MERPIGIILAGGRARRMGGGDKALLEFGGRTLLSRVMARLDNQVSEMVLNANGDSDRFRACGLPVISDSVEGFVGPLGGVLAGMDWAAEHGSQHVVTVAADTPFFPTDLVSVLSASLDGSACQIALASTPHPKRGAIRHPTFGLWPVSLRDDLRQALTGGVRKVVQWSDPHGVVAAEFPVSGTDPFFNINTPEDLQLARTLDLATTP